MPTVETFLGSRREDWSRLEALLHQARGGNLRRLSAEELEQLGRLHRRLASDLAIAQRDFPGDPLTRYLNQLLARSHAHVYQPEATTWRRLWAFALERFPQLYRRNLAFILVAAALLALPGLAAYVAASTNPAATEPLLAPELVDYLKRGELWTEIPSQVRPFASSLITTNNIQVTFFAFAGGVLAGLGTVYVLVQNGLMLGAIVGLAQAHGLAGELLTFVAAHGVIELSVVAVAGGAGLKLGWALLRPGLLGRRDSLMLAGREAVQLILGAVPLLAIAGLVEAFISPSDLPWAAKAAFGLATGVLLYGYLLLAGRQGAGRDR